MSLLKTTNKSIILLALSLFVAALSLGLAQGSYWPAVSEAKPSGGVKQYSPKKYVAIPERYQACVHCKVDARIKRNVVYLARKYNLKISQGRAGGSATPSVTHGAGTAVDFIGKKRSLRRANRALKDVRAIKYHSVDFGSHLHVSWRSSCNGCQPGQWVKPRKWVMSFNS